MTMDFFRALTNLYFDNCNQSEEALASYVQTSLAYYKQSEDAKDFSDVVEELINHGQEDLVYSYLIEEFNGTHEFGLSQIIAKIPVDFSQEIIGVAVERAIAEGSGEINLNALLLNFINNNDKESVADFEAKVQTIIRCMNEATKQQAAALQQKENEIRELRISLNEQVNAEMVLAEIKEPLTDLERHIAISVQSKGKRHQRLIEIASDLRQKIETLYGILPVESAETWRMQTAVPYNPAIHKLLDKPESVTEGILVHVESLGFSLATDGVSPIMVKASVSVAKPETPPEKKKSKKAAEPKNNEGNIDVPVTTKGEDNAT